MLAWHGERCPTDRVQVDDLTKYGGNTSKCHDLARATVSVLTRSDIVNVVLAVLACPLIAVIRIKNRMDPACDVTAIGGYRDVQFQCLMRDAAGNWFYVELQINLVAMIVRHQGRRRRRRRAPRIRPSTAD